MQKEIHRQVVHFLAGNTVIALLAFTTSNSIDKMILLAFLIALFIIGYALARHIRRGHSIPLFSSLVKHLERDHEQDFPGKPAFMLLLGTILVIGLFNTIPALIALIVLTYGDTVATLIGKYRGKIELISNRTLEGTASGIIVSGLMLLTLLPADLAFGMAIIGMLAEYLPIDDNIGIPVVTALAASLLVG